MEQQALLTEAEGGDPAAIVIVRVSALPLLVSLLGKGTRVGGAEQASGTQFPKKV